MPARGASLRPARSSAAAVRVTARRGYGLRRASRPLQERGSLRPPQLRALPRLLSPWLSKRMAFSVRSPNFTLNFACAWLISRGLAALSICKAERQPYTTCVLLLALPRLATFSLSVLHYWLKSTCLLINCVNFACQLLPSSLSVMEPYGTMFRALLPG